MDEDLKQQEEKDLKQQEEKDLKQQEEKDLEKEEETGGTLSEKRDLLIKLRILKSTGSIQISHSEDMRVQELREIYDKNFSCYQRDKEIKNKEDLIRKLRWLNYDEENGHQLKSLSIKDLIMLYSNLLKEKNLTEKDMDNYIQMIGILMMFADK